MQPIDSNLLKLLIPVAVCHAIGHVTSNVSFAAVAVSFTHTVKGIKKDGTDRNSSYENWSLNIDHCILSCFLDSFVSTGTFLQCGGFPIHPWAADTFDTMAISCTSRNW